MNLKLSLIFLLASAVVACGDPIEPSNESADTTSLNQSKSSTQSKRAESGSIDIVASGKTVEVNSKNDPNSKQCQLNFTVENRGESEIKSLLVDYDVLNKATGAVIAAQSQFIIAAKIGLGETVSTLGANVVDDYRCTELTLHFPEQASYKCRTTTKAKCASFTFNGTEDVMVARAVSSNSDK